MDHQHLLNCLLIWISLIASLRAQTYTISPSSVIEENGKPTTYTCTTSPAQTTVKWTEDLNDEAPASYIFGFFGSCILSVGTPPADYVFDCDASGTFTVTFNVTFKRNYNSKWKCGINTAPTPESAWSDLNVTVPLTTLTVSENASVEDGDTAQLRCTTNPCSPVPVISWIKDNVAFSLGSVNQSQTFTDNGFIGVSVLSLQNITKNFTGSYSCSATYGSNNFTSEPSSLTVTDKVTAPPPTTSPVPGDTDCLIILIIIIIIIVILVLALIIFHIVIFYVKVSFKVMGILFFVNVILAVAAIIIGIVGIVAFALCEVIAAITAIVIGALTHLYKFFLSKRVLKKADVPHRHLFCGFFAYPWKTGDASGDDPDAPTNTPATVETIGESSSGNSRVTRNQETVLLTNKTTNSQETDERKDGNKATPAEYGNMNMNIPALGLQSNQGKAQTGDGNGGQTGNETSKSEKGEKKKGSKKKKSKKKKEKQDGSQSPPAVSVSGVAVDDPKTAEEPEEQIRSDSNLTKVVG